jgi:hypothetical protein
VIAVFLSAPVRPYSTSTAHFTRAQNLTTARGYYRTLSLAYPDHAFLAPWILNCDVFEDSPVHVEIGMVRNLFWIRKCSELWLCGDYISDGMLNEEKYALSCNVIVRRGVLSQPL